MYTNVTEQYVMKKRMFSLEFEDRKIIDVAFVDNQAICLVNNNPGLCIVGENIDDYVVTNENSKEAWLNVLDAHTFYLYSQGTVYSYYAIHGNELKEKTCHETYRRGIKPFTTSGLSFGRYDVTISRGDEELFCYNCKGFKNDIIHNPGKILVDKLMFIDNGNAMIYEENTNKCRSLLKQRFMECFAYDPSTHIIVTDCSQLNYVWDERYLKLPVSILTAANRLIADIRGDYLYFVNLYGTYFVNYKTGHIVENARLNPTEIYPMNILTPDLCEYSHCGGKELYITEYSL